MSKFSGILVCLCLGFLLSCNKESNDGPTSAEGKWTYTTPDGKLVVTFDLVKGASGGLDIQNPTIKVNGNSGTAAATITGVNLPTIAQIRVSANDAALVYPHSVTFINGKVSNDFRRIEVPDTDYVFYASSSPTTSTLKTQTIVRP